MGERGRESEKKPNIVMGKGVNNKRLHGSFTLEIRLNSVFNGHLMQ